MNLNEYLNCDATEISQLVKSKSISPEEVLELAIEQAELVNPKLNAIILEMFDRARNDAKSLSLEGSFAGVPFLIKDLLQEYEGLPMSHGSKALRDYIPSEHSELVKGFIKSGLLIMGKTNTPEFGLTGVTEPKYFGVTKNPWNLEHSSGGSSGGSAAAVAAGVVPMAGAGDGGGSIRIPAACCGLVGLKASRGRFPASKVGDSWDGAVVEGVLTRTIRDTALALETFQGQSSSSAYKLERLSNVVDQVESSTEKKFKIMVVTKNPIPGATIDPEVESNILAAAKELEAQGHTIEFSDLDIDGLAAAKSYLTMYFGHVAKDVEMIKSKVGAHRMSEVELTTKLLHGLGRSISAYDYVEAKSYWATLTHKIETHLQDFDLILTPTMASAAPKHHSFDPKGAQNMILQTAVKLKCFKTLLKLGLVEELAKDSLGKLPFTFLTNLSGHPSISIPYGQTKNGLPLALHFTASIANEIDLLSIGRQVELMGSGAMGSGAR